MKMKKMLALSASLLFLVSMATGCGQDPAELLKDAGVETETTAPADDAEDEETTEADEDAVADDTAIGDFEEVVLVDNEYCTIKATGIEMDSTGYYYLVDIYLENKTSDKKMRFTAEDVSINGVMCDPFWMEDVTAGSKANSTLSWSSTQLEDSNITDVTEICGTIRVYNSEDYEEDDYVNESFAIYPQGEENAISDGTADVDGMVMIDNDQCKVVAVGYIADDDLGYTVKMYLENKTDMKLAYDAEDVTVNGFMCDPYWSTEVAPGKVAYSDMTFYSSDFESNGITDVEEIQMTVNVGDADDWSADPIASVSYVLKP